MLRQIPVLKLIAVFMLALSCTTVFAQQNETAALLNKYRQIKNADSADNYARQLTAIAKKTHNKIFEAQVLFAQSYKAYITGDEIRAMDLAYQANKIVSVKDPATYTRSAIMVANLLGRRGRNPEAMKAAFTILRKTDAQNWQRESLACLISIGNLYRSIGDPFKGRPYALQAMKESQALKDTTMYLASLNLLCSIYSYTSIETPAYNKIALAYQEAIFKPEYVATMSAYDKANYLSNLGRIYRKIDRFDTAKIVLKQSVAISTRENFLAVKKHSLNELMTIEIDQHHYQAGIDYAQQVLAAQPEAQSNRIQTRDIYWQLSNAYWGVGNYKMAFEYKSRYIDLKDSLNDLNKDRVATELAEKYKADKRLLLAANQKREATLQRDLIIAIAIILLLASIATFRWFASKKKRENAVLNERHRQLAQLDTLKTRFFANISHELRTPLTLIMGPTEQLLNKAPIDEQQQQTYLQAVFRNSKKLLNLVDELLDLGKIEADTLLVKLKPVDIAWFVNVIYQGFASAAAYKNIAFTLLNNIAQDSFVQLDADKFEKIVNNLLSNAIKFTQLNGSVHVIAAINDGLIELTVMDNGKGIPDDELPLIFNRYYQGNRGVAEGGTGIGLAIALEFSELMGGTITVKSNPGRGSTFKLSLPEIPAPAETATEKLSIVTPNTEEIAGGEAEKLILLVEDHHEMAQYISSILKPYYRIVTAHNGQEALDQLKLMSTLPDLIVSDVMMPEMDGFTLLKHIKQDAVLCRVPIIMLTALGDSQNKLRALNIGVDDYLTKPFVSGELLARATNLIGNATQRLSLTATDEQELVELSSQEPASADNEPVAETSYVSPSDLLWLTSLETTVRKYIGKSLLNVAILSDDMALSERQLFRRIKQTTGLTPNMYIRNIRLQIAREAIESGRYRTISEISYIAGFETPAYFSKLFKEQYGRDVTELL
ncbi:ATP-binding protein [Pedobacter duraquae]|uniref:histidine kinase n=1 Tax=Pedobacter duraquae TaxID=425511 RepID=A0A4R6IKQ0_9SPHI|nr:ATP-binding protein [Pedobacter duraquae]TDO22516.1 helix-turn-helix protein [Pedobacter duraquae]